MDDYYADDDGEIVDLALVTTPSRTTEDPRNTNSVNQESGLRNLLEVPPEDSFF